MKNHFLINMTFTKNMHNIRKSWEHIKHMTLKHKTGQEKLITSSYSQSRRKKYGYWDIISALTSKFHPARYDFLHRTLAHTTSLFSTPKPFSQKPQPRLPHVKGFSSSSTYILELDVVVFTLKI